MSTELSIQENPKYQELVRADGQPVELSAISALGEKMHLAVRYEEGPKVAVLNVSKLVLIDLLAESEFGDLAPVGHYSKLVQGGVAHSDPNINNTLLYKVVPAQEPWQQAAAHTWTSNDDLEIKPTIFLDIPKTEAQLDAFVKKGFITEQNSWITPVYLDRGFTQILIATMIATLHEKGVTSLKPGMFNVLSVMTWTAYHAGINTALNIEDAYNHSQTQETLKKFLG